MIRFERILCPTDFSKFSFRASDYAVALARSDEGEVHFIHVIPGRRDQIPGPTGCIRELQADIGEVGSNVLHVTESERPPRPWGSRASTHRASLVELP